MTDIILATEEFSSSGWTDYGANYFLDRISTLADGSVSSSGFTGRFYYRNTGDNNLFPASDQAAIDLAASFEGKRNANSSFTLNFLSSLTFDELYFAVFYDDPILAVTAPVFIKQVDNTAYTSGAPITINNFEISFVQADPTAPFEFPEIDPFLLDPITVNYTGNGSFNAGLPFGLIDQVAYTGNGSLEFNLVAVIANERFTESGETRIIEDGTIRVIES